jgi:hypothetical protein
VGAGHPTSGIQASSATFDAASEVDFEITGSGTTADSDYGQLSAGGPIALDGASLGVLVAPTSGTSCPTPSPGQTYTFVSTTGTLSGSFGNAPEGTEIPVRFSNVCASQPSVHLRIAYHKSGGTQTVTGTVPGGTEISEPKNTVNPYVRPEDNREWGAIAGAQAVAEHWAQKHAAEAAAKAREEAEQQARAAHTTVSLLSTVLAAQRGGVAFVELTCMGSAGETCAGKLALSVRLSAGKGRRSHTPTVGTASFSIVAGKTASVRIRLNTTGRALLRKDHGRLNASLAILQSAPANHFQTMTVHLRQQKTRGPH